MLGEADGAAAVLGAEVMTRLTRSARVVPHPRQEEWSRQRRASLTPILRLAKVRSWREFVSSADLVEVERQGDAVTVGRMRRLQKPMGAFEPDIGAQRLHAPSPAELAEAIMGAFART
jgi:hypothetical protein